MSSSLIHHFQMLYPLNPALKDYLMQLEKTIDQDLWRSAGGHWSTESKERIRKTAMEKLAQNLSSIDLPEAWSEVVRDFHQNYWDEVRIPQKEPKPVTAKSKMYKELFSYIWIAVQAVLIMKVVVLYFGLKAADSDDPMQKVYLFAVIAFSFSGLIYFAYRRIKSR